MTNQSYIHLCHLIRTGEIAQPQPRHDNPADYGLTRKDAINARIRHLRPLKAEIDMRVSRWSTRMLLGVGTQWYNEYKLLESVSELDKINKEIKFNLGRMKCKEDTPEGYDIAHIKTIPMDRITAILPNGFFINNPFRNEKSPSNSLHWDKRINRFKDFGTDRHGDVIDVYMAINKCTLKEALKELSNL